MDSLENYLEQTIDDMSATWPEYQDLRPVVSTHPIPFFGDIKNARVLTVGVNPSAGEFSKKRSWPDKMTPNELNNRLQNYFVSEQHRQHKWFDTWEQALKPLEVSYQKGAAHIDLSPRPTVSMSQANRNTFLTMMKQDAQWFFELLSVLSEYNAPRLLLLSGTVASRYYMDEFVECVAYRHGFRLEGPPTPRGEGTGFNRLSGGGVDTPTFFSSVSPSAGKRRHELTQRVKDNQMRLYGYINK